MFRGIVAMLVLRSRRQNLAVLLISLKSRLGFEKNYGLSEKNSMSSAGRGTMLVSR